MKSMSRSNAVIGTVSSLWRYPVKSMLGERCEALRIESRGATGDRLFAVRDEAGKFGSGKTTRRFRRIDGLFRFRARYVGLVPEITFPDGRVLRADQPEQVNAALSSELGLPVTLSREAEVSHFDSAPLHLVTSASLRTLGGELGADAIDERRFRPNLVISTEASGFAEEDWLGRELRLGEEVRLRITSRTERCVMITHAQDELSDDPRILRELARINEACFGVYAAVLTPGVVRVGDSLRFES